MHVLATIMLKTDTKCTAVYFIGDLSHLIVVGVSCNSKGEYQLCSFVVYVAMC